MKKNIAGIVGLLIICIIIVAGFLIKNFSSIKDFSNSLVILTKQNNESDQIVFDLNSINGFINSTQKLTSKKIITNFLPPQQKEFVNNINAIIPDLKTVLNELILDEQKWIVIYQNSNELRATGGFMGSYSIVDINQGKIVSINTEDIYDADGQFTGFVQAPPGVKEYLSGGKGLRLPDANWNPDSSKSAQQILPFYALGNKTNIKGIIFVNLDFAKNLLSFIGPVNIPDYNTIVTPDNIDEVLRSRRDDFFPGSAQKKHILSQLLTKVRIQILSLKPDELIKLANLVVKEINNHNLQFYSNNENIDQVFNKHNMRQILNIKDNSDYIYLVESNVGINKANKNIVRQVTLTKDQNTMDVKINFLNNNSKPSKSRLSEITTLVNNDESSNEAQINNHLAYINYQRVLVPSDWTLNSINYQSNEITEFDLEEIEVNGYQFKQIGFLITLTEENTSQLNISFSTTKNNDSIYIQLQPGLPATKYILEYNQNNKEVILENNQQIKYP